MLLEVGRRFLDHFEVEAFVGIEIEDHPVGLLDVGDEAPPAVELDRPHLDADQHAVGVVDVEIGLDRSVLLADVDVVDVVAEAAGVVLLEEAVLGAPLRAADQADRAAGEPAKRERRDRGVIVGEIALGDARTRDRSRGRDC